VLNEPSRNLGRFARVILGEEPSTESGEGKPQFGHDLLSGGGGGRCAIATTGEVIPERGKKKTKEGSSSEGVTTLSRKISQESDLRKVLSKSRKRNHR